MTTIIEKNRELVPPDSLVEFFTREEGFGLEGVIEVGVGSWGVVAGKQARDLSEMIKSRFSVDLPGFVYKAANDNDYFVTRGQLAERLLDEEVEVGLKQEEFGVPPTLARLWVHTDDRLRFYEEDPRLEGAELVVVMPWFPQENMMAYQLKSEIEKESVGKIMKNMMQRMEAMFVPITSGVDIKYLLPESVGNLIVDDRMIGCEDESYQWHQDSGYINSRISEEIKNLYGLITRRLLGGRAGEQHGDPRPVDNVVVHVDGNGDWQTVVLDAVRLAVRTDPDNPEIGMIKKEWYTTDTILQAGMALGKLYAMGKKDWFAEGVRAYEEVFEDPILGNEEMERFFGVALVYGMSVDAHVLNRRYYAGERGGDLEEDLNMLWSAMGKLAEDTTSWKEMLDGA